MLLKTLNYLVFVIYMRNTNRTKQLQCHIYKFEKINVEIRTRKYYVLDKPIYLIVRNYVLKIRH